MSTVCGASGSLKRVSGDPLRPSVYFALEVTLDYEFTDAFQTEPYTENERLIASVRNPLEAIFGIGLHVNDNVMGTYVNIKDGLSFQVQPTAVLPSTEDAFLDMMATLARDGRIVNAETNEDMLTVVQAQIQSHIPSNARVIGCVCGSNDVLLKDHLATITDFDRPIVFVIGNNVSRETTAYVQDFVKVHSSELTTEACLGQIDGAAAIQWNI